MTPVYSLHFCIALLSCFNELNDDDDDDDDAVFTAGSTMCLVFNGSSTHFQDVTPNGS